MRAALRVVLRWSWPSLIISSRDCVVGAAISRVRLVDEPPEVLVSVVVVPVRPVSRLTVDVLAIGLRCCVVVSRTSSPPVPPNGPIASETRCHQWPSSGTPTLVSLPCSTGLPAPGYSSRMLCLQPLTPRLDAPPPPTVGSTPSLTRWDLFDTCRTTSSRPLHLLWRKRRWPMCSSTLWMQMIQIHSARSTQYAGCCRGLGPVIFLRFSSLTRLIVLAMKPS